MEEKTTNDEVNLMEYFSVIKKRKYFIVGFVLLAVVLTAGLTLMSQKQYQTESLVLFGKMSNLYALQPANAIELLKSKKIIEGAVQELQSKKLLDTTKINQNTWVEIIKNSLQLELILKTDILRIVIQFNDPQIALAINNYLSGFLINKGNQKIKEYIAAQKSQIEINQKRLEDINNEIENLKSTKDTFLSQGKTEEYTMLLQSINILKSEYSRIESSTVVIKENLLKTDLFELVSSPELPENSIKPNIKRNTIAAFIISLFVAIFLVFILEEKERIIKG